MKRKSVFRANTGLLGAFFLIALTGLTPAGVLYWLMRPTVIVNPGVSAYQAPKPDPLLPRGSNYALTSHVSPFGAAKQQSDLRSYGRSAFAAAQKALPEAASADIGKKKRQVKPRSYARRFNSPLAYEATNPISSWPVGTYGSTNWYR
jgi:hypothetical protein